MFDISFLSWHLLMDLNPPNSAWLRARCREPWTRCWNPLVTMTCVSAMFEMDSIDNQRQICDQLSNQGTTLLTTVNLPYQMFHFFITRPFRPFFFAFEFARRLFCRKSALSHGSRCCEVLKSWYSLRSLVCWCCWWTKFPCYLVWMVWIHDVDWCRVVIVISKLWCWKLDSNQVTWHAH